VDGVFAAGDIREGPTKRVAAAVGDGSSVIRSIHRYLGFAAGSVPGPGAIVQAVSSSGAQA
jgi:hypothetical protein